MDEPSPCPGLGRFNISKSIFQHFVFNFYICSMQFQHFRYQILNMVKKNVVRVEHVYKLIEPKWALKITDLYIFHVIDRKKFISIFRRFHTFQSLRFL